MTADGMGFQVSTYGAVVLTKQVLADIFEKMKMADVVWYVWKDMLDGFQNRTSHVVDHGNRLAVGLPHFVQERNQLVGIFGGQLDVTQHDPGELVDGCHEVGAVPFASPIQMQDIAAPGTHERFELLLALFMGQCQVDNKSPSKMVNLSWRDVDASFTELTLDLFSVTTAHKQRLSDIYDDIVGEEGAGGHHLA